MKIGDRVKKADADDPECIPAYRALRGTVVEVSPTGAVRVHWDIDRDFGCGPDHGFRRVASAPESRFTNAVIAAPSN